MTKLIGAYIAGVATILLGALVSFRWHADAASMALVGAGTGILGWMQKRPAFAKKAMPTIPPEGTPPA